MDIKKTEAELIQRLMIYPEKSLSVAQIISNTDFEYYGKAFDVILQSYIDGVEHHHQLRKAGFNFTEFQFDGVHSYRNPDEIAKEVKNLSNARNVKKILTESQKNIPKKEIDKFISELQVKLINNIGVIDREKTNINEIAQEFLQQREEYLKKPAGSLIGISTGLKKLDDMIDGFRPEHVWIIGGYTSMGKTFASLNLVANIIKQGRRSVIYSLEMSKNDVIARLLGIMTKQNGLAIMKGSSHKPIQETLEKIIDSNLSIITSKSELTEITFSMYEENMKSPVDLFVVDFMQLVTLKNSKSEYETTTEVALQMQQTAKKLKKPIVLVSQISNDGAKNPENQVMSFKGSGAIAAAADIAIELVRGKDETSQSIADKLKDKKPIDITWLVKKNRHGMVGKLDLNFDGHTGRFMTDEELLNEKF